MSHRLYQRMVGLVALAMTLAAIGCSTQPTGNTNASMSVNANSNTAAMSNENANTAASATTAGTFSTREPDRYSMKMNVSVEGSANNRQGGTQVEIDFARLDANRRWSIKVPAMNNLEVVYLEKPGLKYLVIPSQNKYVEITQDAVGMPLGSILTPSAMMERLQARPHESLGTEAVNGRPAMKYRFTGAANTGTSAGTAQADSFIYVDQETNLPLRIDLTATTTSGATARGVVESRDIQLNPDPTQFDVPTGYQKVTAEQLKQQVQGFIQLIRMVAPYLGQQSAQPPAASTTPTPATTNANRAASNSNANRP
jgi:hypothetical protein